MSDEQKIKEMAQGERGRLGEALEALRLAKKLEVPALAEALGIKRNTYYTLERGSGSASLTAQAVRALGTSVDGLLSWYEAHLATLAALPAPPTSEAKGA